MFRDDTRTYINILNEDIANLEDGQYAAGVDSLNRKAFERLGFHITDIGIHVKELEVKNITFARLLEARDKDECDLQEMNNEIRSIIEQSKNIKSQSSAEQKRLANSNLRMYNEFREPLEDIVGSLK